MVNPRMGQTVYYMINETEFRPMLVVHPEKDYVEGYVYCRLGDQLLVSINNPLSSVVYKRATYGGRAFPRDSGHIKEGTWFWPFPEL